MKNLSLVLPGFTSTPIYNPAESAFPSSSFTLGYFISQLLPIVIDIAAFLAFIWLVWGGFQYLTAGGNKEGLAKARARITWAIVGLLITAIAFAIAQFGQQIILPGGTTPIL